MFPLKKNNININNTEKGFLKDYINSTEIPLLPHPGAFGKERKFHKHEGVDLYCNQNDAVVAIEDGIVVNILPFTGEIAGSEWWNNTWCILIEGISGVYNYGEIKVKEDIKLGDRIKEGDVLGLVETVLKKDKGRPMSMLHLELYEIGTKIPLSGWNKEQEKPLHLLDPTNNLMSYLVNQTRLKRGGFFV